MQYALLMYSSADRADAARGPIDPAVAEVLERPDIASWLRLYPHDYATTVRHEQGATLLTDGPFIDSKEFLGGFIVVEAADLDGALALAAELHERHPIAAIEVRPVLGTS
jgi:hypothetical protein